MIEVKKKTLKIQFFFFLNFSSGNSEKKNDNEQKKKFNISMSKMGKIYNFGQKMKRKYSLWCFLDPFNNFKYVLFLKC